MRHIIFITFIFISCLVIMCTEFPTSFERIDSNELRVLDFIYEPAEASPGDTVRVKAIFSGKEFSASDVQWKISPNLIVDKYGTDTVFDVIPLNPVPEKSYFSDNTTCFNFSFVIPPDIFKTHGQIPNNWTEVLPEEILKSLPPDIVKLPKSDFIDMIDMLTESPQMYSSISEQLNLPKDQISSMLPVLSQFFTVQMRILADVKNELSIKSDYTVRYNTRFNKIPEVAVGINHNPVIDSIGIYKVSGNIDEYDPKDQKHQFVRIDKENDTQNIISIEDDYSYFLAAFYNHPDTTRTLIDLLNYNPSDFHLEKISTIWFFQQDDNETKDISTNDFMKTGGGDTKSYDDKVHSTLSYHDLISTTKLFTPKNKSIKKIRVWCQVQDRSSNEIFRPVGSTLMEGAFTFKY